MLEAPLITPVNWTKPKIGKIMMEAPLNLHGLIEIRWNNHQLTDLGCLCHADQPRFSPCLKEEAQLVSPIEGEDSVRLPD